LAEAAVEAADAQVLDSKAVLAGVAGFDEAIGHLTVQADGLLGIVRLGGTGQAAGE
jgi:hypothetical protein